MSLDQYKDKWGRVHDKPKKEGSDYPSGNPWIYSAIATKLGESLTLTDSVGEICATRLVRHPDIYEYGSAMSPISRDEILGLAHLGFLKPEHFKGWSYSPFVIPKFNLLDTLRQAYNLVDWKTRTLKHRTTFWKEGYSQIYRFAFSVPFQDRHFINKCWGRYNPLWHLIHIIAHRKQPEHRTSRLLRYLKTGQDKEAVANYFGEQHPLSKL
jgi:hypothetical protein